MKANDNPKSKRTRKNPSSRGAMVGISCVVVLLMAVLLVQGFSLSKKIESNTEKAKLIEQQLEAEHERTKEIEATQEYMKTPEYIEKAARDNGLAKDNEIIFKEVK